MSIKERYCPVVGKNVAVEENDGKRLECRSILACGGKCKNRYINKK